MSYGFYVYTDRESIETTKVYSSQSGATYSYSYGSGQKHLEGFSDGSYLRFTATPSDGYEFKQWVYHIGSTSAPTQYSTSNPFTYYGSTDNDIYIAAEGKSTSSGGDSGGDSGETDGEWNLKQYTSKQNSFSVSLNFSEGVCYCIPITFSYSGKATFYSNSYNNGTAADMHAYLSTSKSFDTSSGEPTTYLIMNEDSDKEYSDTMSSSDFGFEYNIVAGVTYYLFIREYDVDYYPGTIKIYCVAPEESDYFEWSSSVAQGLPIKNVSHTEWDNFIDKIIDVLTDKGLQNTPITAEKYGYSIGTTYLTMLKDCYMTYDSDLEGYPLTAKMFNIARFIIGSNVSTGISDKTSKTSKVLASEFITLANCLKSWQG